jgi:hypothetical protein
VRWRGKPGRRATATATVLCAGARAFRGIGCGNRRSLGGVAKQIGRNRVADAPIDMKNQVDSASSGRGITCALEVF